MTSVEIPEYGLEVIEFLNACGHGEVVSNWKAVAALPTVPGSRTIGVMSTALLTPELEARIARGRSMERIATQNRKARAACQLSLLTLLGMELQNRNLVLTAHIGAAQERVEIPLYILDANSKLDASLSRASLGGHRYIGLRVRKPSTSQHAGSRRDSNTKNLSLEPGEYGFAKQLVKRALDENIVTELFDSCGGNLMDVARAILKRFGHAANGKPVRSVRDCLRKDDGVKRLRSDFLSSTP